jgi:small nuclear ribonucleoprotein (snRNP)-like protein
LVVLRDGRKLIGILRSYDQFGATHTPCVCYMSSCRMRSRWDHHAANLVLQDTIERIHVGAYYGDVTRGIFLVRGENVVLMGEIVRCGRTRARACAAVVTCERGQCQSAHALLLLHPRQDEAREDLGSLQQVSFEEILQLQRDELDARERADRVRQRVLRDRGVAVEVQELEWF